MNKVTMLQFYRTCLCNKKTESNYFINMSYSLLSQYLILNRALAMPLHDLPNRANIPLTFTRSLLSQHAGAN